MVKDILKIREEDICPITDVRGDISRNKLKFSTEKFIDKYVNEMKIAEAAQETVLIIIVKLQKNQKKTE